MLGGCRGKFPSATAGECQTANTTRDRLRDSTGRDEISVGYDGSDECESATRRRTWHSHVTAECGRCGSPLRHILHVGFPCVVVAWGVPGPFGPEFVLVGFSSIGSLAPLLSFHTGKKPHPHGMTCRSRAVRCAMRILRPTEARQL